MAPLKLLEQLLPRLRKYPNQFALAGGLAASFYRDRPRLTNDVDIAWCLGGYEKSKQAAIEVIESLGYDVAHGWIYTGEKRLLKPTPMIIGRKRKESLDATVDFLLPTFPWVEKAVERAQHHKIDFGFAKLPTITVEDLLLAKLLALEIEPTRFQDLDDIKSIFQADNAIDLTYLVSECEKLELRFPKILAPSLPPALRRIAKRFADVAR